MASKLIDLSFTLNGRKVKVQIAPDPMLFALLREQGCASVRCACEPTNCGLCTVWLDGDPVLSCSVPAGAACASFGSETFSKITTPPTYSTSTRHTSTTAKPQLCF